MDRSFCYRTYFSIDIEKLLEEGIEKPREGIHECEESKCGAMESSRECKGVIMQIYVALLEEAD